MCFPCRLHLSPVQVSFSLKARADPPAAGLLWVEHAQTVEGDTKLTVRKPKQTCKSERHVELQKQSFQPPRSPHGCDGVTASSNSAGASVELLGVPAAVELFSDQQLENALQISPLGVLSRFPSSAKRPTCRMGLQISTDMFSYLVGTSYPTLPPLFFGCLRRREAAIQ